MLDRELTLSTVGDARGRLMHAFDGAQLVEIDVSAVETCDLAGAQLLVAAPGLLASLPRPIVPADLAALPSLHWGNPQRDYQWQLNGPDGATASLRHTPRLVTDDLVVLRQAALAPARSGKLFAG